MPKPHSYPPRPTNDRASSRTSSGRKDVVTLDRAFSKAGIFSRTEAAKRIRGGHVQVNGRTVRDPNCWVSKTDRIAIDGENLRSRKKVYLLFYKPTDVVTSHGDPGNRRTVYDFLTDLSEWVFPVGRLDKDTSGLLILTNDTEFGDRLTNPNSHIPKTYQVKTNFHPTPEQLRRLQSGLTLANGQKVLPAKVQILRQTAKCTFLQLTITEGKNRQVRRMIEALGGRVLKLVRTAIGNLHLGNLQIGHYRVLNRVDLGELWEMPSSGSTSTPTN